MAELPLARDFPAADKADWKTLVEKALKGAPFASLESKSYDGIAIEPLYSPAKDAALVPGRAPGTPWEVMQRIEIADGETANRQILEDLNNGANSLALVFQGSVGDYGYGLPPLEAVLEAALKDVHFDWGIAVELQLGPLCKDAALMLANLVQQRGHAPQDVNIRFGFDPIGVLAVNGWNNVVWPDMAPVFASLVAEMKSQGFAGPFATADGRPIHAAGGSEAQELAFALSTAAGLSPRIGSRRHAPRRSAASRLLPPRRRPEPNSHHRQVPQPSEAVVAGGRSLRAPARGGLRHG